jgi:hypothetical protein
LSTTTASPTPASSGSKSNTGAIVGGVIGGLAVIGAFVLGIVYLLMRRKRTNDANAAGYYGGEPKPGVSSQGGYAQPVNKDRVSYYGNQNPTSPVPPYGPPMEMQDTSPGGQHIYEAPGLVMQQQPVPQQPVQHQPVQNQPAT